MLIANSVISLSSSVQPTAGLPVFHKPSIFCTMRSNITQRFNKSDRFIWLVTFLYLIVSNTINGSGTVLFGFTFLVLLFSNFKLKFYKYHIFTLQFCLYCYATTFWAFNGRYTISVCNAIFMTLICLFVFYEYWKDVQDIHILLRIIMWAGFFVVIYTYYYYGVEDIVTAEGEDRLGNEFNNVNTIAMMTAITLIINFYLRLYVKKDWSVLIWIPCLLIIGATQCRKAFVMLIMGIFILYYYKQKMERKGDMLLPITKILVFVLIGIVILLVLGHTNVFSGLYNRMGGLISSVTGGEDIDASSQVRNTFFEIGWRQFLQNPIVGIGMNNSMIILSQQTGRVTYLHNNYIEIASSGGIIGLISYYSMFVYLLSKEIKYIRLDSSAVLIVTWILIRFVTDWGAVSYSSRTTYLYLMVFFIHLDNMKKKYPRIR